jgi:uncharacterized protein with FMN-binding domain
MKQVPAAVLAGTVALQTGSAWAATHAASGAKSSKSQTFKGPIEEMRWGPIQVAIVVKNKKITNVKVGANPDSPRSYFIQSQAVPILRQETLKAQSANIDEVSGATDVSDAFIQSLQAAIKSAQHHRALK